MDRDCSFERDLRAKACCTTYHRQLAEIDIKLATSLCALCLNHSSPGGLTQSRDPECCLVISQRQTQLRGTFPNPALSETAAPQGTFLTWHRKTCLAANGNPSFVFGIRHLTCWLLVPAVFFLSRSTSSNGQLARVERQTAGDGFFVACHRTLMFCFRCTLARCQC